LIAEKHLDPAKIPGTGPGGRISKGDVLLYLEQAPAGIPESFTSPQTEAVCLSEDSEEEIRKPMSPIRKRIAERLLDSKQNTAMLTTFNEIDMHQAMTMRTLFKDAFQKKHDVSLGFMSFFIKACVEALKEIPEINAFIEGDTLVYHNYQHIGVAIGTDRGLVVPVIRHAEKMSFAGIEKAIVDYVKKIKDNRLELADLEGGTFTVSNGGVYGSLLSTPILNTPQSGILGMHKIEKRPVVIEDEIVIRPMMYVALSYDHRIVDGKGAVTFLKRVKEFIENPERIMLEV
jgi:2-oxoglutarate dehydrogenase E2 component (dihydrolipoamide succinyltransferase)